MVLWAPVFCLKTCLYLFFLKYLYKLVVVVEGSLFCGQVGFSLVDQASGVGVTLFIPPRFVEQSFVDKTGICLHAVDNHRDIQKLHTRLFTSIARSPALKKRFEAHTVTRGQRSNASCRKPAHMPRPCSSIVSGADTKLNKACWVVSAAKHGSPEESERKQPSRGRSISLRLDRTTPPRCACPRGYRLGRWESH